MANSLDGECYRCGETYSGRGMTQHLKSCVDKVRQRDDEWQAGAIRTVARNDALEFNCEVCGDSAEQVCTNCIHRSEGFVCTACDELRHIKEALTAAGRSNEWQQIIDEVLDEYRSYRALQQEVAKTDLVEGDLA